MDPIPLKHIRQIPGITGVVTSLMDMPAGAVWSSDRLEQMKKMVNESGLEAEVIESVNVHEDIKLGLPTRDKYIDNYIDTVKKLANIGVKVICYNFMPVFDWTRTELAKELPDGSNTMYYSQEFIDSITDPQAFADEIQKDNGEFEMAGWEPERMTEIKKLLEKYKSISHEDLLNNLKYFLERVIPVCEECDIKMAIHPDDPPWDIFGLPRVVNSIENLDKVVNLVDSPSNCITFCTGSLGANPHTDLVKAAGYFAGKNKIAFAHLRNLKFVGDGSFYESSHLSSDGSFDMYAIVKALMDNGFDGYVRPDHGRMIWDEHGRAGYGLYDRALGIAYLNGIVEAITKNEQK